MCGGGGGGGDGGAAEREAARQASIKEGYDKIQQIFGGYTDPTSGTVTPGFDDTFYNNRATSYTNYAMPQLDDQYAEAQKQLEFALARNGRLDSSTAGAQKAELQKKYDLQRTSITDKGVEYANNARSSVEGARGDLINMNSNLANPATIANEAANRVTALQAAPTFQPLAPLFTNAGEALGTQADLERRSTARYNSGIFTPTATSTGTGSGRLIK